MAHLKGESMDINVILLVAGGVAATYWALTALRPPQYRRERKALARVRNGQHYGHERERGI